MAARGASCATKYSAISVTVRTVCGRKPGRLSVAASSFKSSIVGPVASNSTRRRSKIS